MSKFNLYFAGFGCKESDPTFLEIGSLRLLSYHLDKPRVKQWVDAKGEIFLDSGAYSAHTSEVEIDVDNYIKYINEHDKNLTCFAQLDKIPGDFRKPKTKEQLEQAPEESWENYLYMKERVKSPEKLLPIYHQGEDFKHLKRMLNYEPAIDYIGISPANDLATNKKITWMQECFKIIRESKNPHVKTHAFGMTSLKVLEYLPFYSADSTSWLMVGKSGSIMTKWGTIVVSENLTKDKHNYKNMSADHQKELRKYVESFGFNMETIKSDYKQRMLFNIYYLQDWAENYQYKPKKIKQSKLF